MMRLRLSGKETDNAVVSKKRKTFEGGYKHFWEKARDGIQ